MPASNKTTSIRSKRLLAKYVSDRLYYIRYMSYLLKIKINFCFTPLDRIEIIKELYDILNEKIFKLIRLIPFSIQGVHRLLLHALHKSFDLETEISACILKKQVSKSMSNTVAKRFKQYRCLFYLFQYEHYYKLWLIRQIFPYDIYRSISQYFTH